MRRTYVMRDGRLVEVVRRPPEEQVHIIGDNMERAVRHPMLPITYDGPDARPTTSKSRVERLTRELGGVTVGNDIKPFLQESHTSDIPINTRELYERAKNELRWGDRPRENGFPSGFFRRR